MYRRPPAINLWQGARREHATTFFDDLAI